LSSLYGEKVENKRVISFPRFKGGNSKAAGIAIIEMTTSNSTKVNNLVDTLCFIIFSLS
jgi:hypothetical protein